VTPSNDANSGIGALTPFVMFLKIDSLSRNETLRYTLSLGNRAS
jgi:hypothetical protein